MNERPDDWLDDLVDKENNPDFSRPSSIREDLSDHAKDAAKDKAKDVAKKAGKGVAKEGAKAGAKAGAEAGAEAAASGAAGAAAGGAAAGGATAVGAGVAATTGVETAGVGVLVGAAIAILGNKKLRNITIGGLGFMLLLFMGITIMTILTPIIIVSSVASEAYDMIEPIVENRAVQLGIKAGTTVVKTQYEIAKDGAGVVKDGVDLAGDAADAVVPGDGAPCVKTRWGDVGCGYNGSTEHVAATDETLGEVLAATDGGATAEDPNSRLNKLAQAMSDQGFFLTLIKKYGINLQTRDGRTFDIVVNDTVVKRNLSEEGVRREFMHNKTLRAIMQSVNEQELHVFDYSKRVTLAEKGMSTYKTQQLFIPGADTAKEDADVAKVRQGSIELQNSPFISAMKSDLKCTTASCTEWVPDTSAADESEMTTSISRETNFDTVGSLYSRMRDRIKENGQSDDPNFVDWYHYVREMHIKADYPDAEARDDPFIKAALAVRKDQATRLWFHQQTLVDQFKASQLTDKSASALFHNFIGGSNAKAYKYLSGQTGGVGFRDYDKINDNKPNVVEAVYRDWQQENPENAEIVGTIVNNYWYRILDIFGLDETLNRLLGSDPRRAMALESAFRAGSKIMLPVCDASRAGPSFVNCLYAGADNTARDVGMSDYGNSGVFSKEEEDKVLGYAQDIDQRVAANKPLFERLASFEGKNSFARKAVLQAAVPVGSNKDLSAFASYLLQLPGHIARLALAPLSGQVLAATEETEINNIDRSGIKLETQQNAPISKTLDNPTGDVSSCPVTGPNEENMCRGDETTYLAMAAKFDLLPSTETDLEFTLGSYNILNAESWPGPSNQIGGCAVSPVPNDPDCSKTRSARQAQIITGQAGNPAFDIVGLQEVSPKQFGQLKTLLGGYNATPANGSRMTNSKDGAVAVFWNAGKFTKFTEGKAAGISNTSKDITVPWVGLQSTNSHKVYVMSVHYPNSSHGGTAEVIRRASRLTMDWVKSKVKDDAVAIVMGDFNDNLGQKLHYCVYTEDSLLQHVHDMEQLDDPGAGCDNPDTPGIDHIYTSPTAGITAKGWTHMQRTGVVASSSDHEPVYSTLMLPGSGDASLKVATFNILHVGDSAFERQWRTRMPTSIGVLKQNSITVAGLQEVRPEQHKLLTTESYSTDTFDIFPKTAQQPNFSPNPIIWNKSLFKLVSGKTLPIEYDNGGKIDHAVLVLLKDVLGNQFYVLNTHDPANARPGSDEQNALSRFNNAKYYKQYLVDLAKQGKPIFLTGDFNSSYTMGGNQKPYNNLAQNLTYCVISSGGTLKNVWDIFQNKPFNCPRNSVPGDAPIDHIYVANISGVSRVWTAASRTNGSDHPTVMADVDVPWAKEQTGSGGGAWSLPVARSGWESDGQRWLEAHYTGSDAWTNNIKAASDINIGSGDSDCGKPVFSMFAGTIVNGPPTYTMQVKSVIGGKTVIITYAHGNNEKQSGAVKAGDQIMTIGKNSSYSGMTCHLHLEISYNGRPVCPQDVLPLVARGQTPDLASLSTRARYVCG